MIRKSLQRKSRRARRKSIRGGYVFSPGMSDLHAAETTILHSSTAGMYRSSISEVQHVWKTLKAIELFGPAAKTREKAAMDLQHFINSLYYATM